MEAIAPIPRVDAFDISARGRIAAASGWHTAEKRVNTIALRADPEVPNPIIPAWPALVTALGGDLLLSNRRAAELQPTLSAVNAIIDALNALPKDVTYADLERALGLREPRESHDRIGDAMSRIVRSLETRRADSNRSGTR